MGDGGLDALDGEPVLGEDDVVRARRQGRGGEVRERDDLVLGVEEVRVGLGRQRARRRAHERGLRALRRAVPVDGVLVQHRERRVPERL